MQIFTQPLRFHKSTLTHHYSQTEYNSLNFKPKSLTRSECWANLCSMKNPLEGITLEVMVTKLVENYGWERLGEKIRIKCFVENPSVKSSLTFLRKTPWARNKVEQLYLWRSQTGWDPRDNVK